MIPYRTVPYSLHCMLRCCTTGKARLLSSGCRIPICLFLSRLIPYDGSDEARRGFREGADVAKLAKIVKSGFHAQLNQDGDCSCSHQTHDPNKVKSEEDAHR